MTYSESYIIFTGGMPRASHGDRYTVSVMRGDDSHVVLDFTSKVVDFIVLGSKEESTSNDTCTFVVLQLIGCCLRPTYP